MMEKIAVHMRISGITVNDEDVNSRRAAATSLATKWGKERALSTIVSKAAEVADSLGGDGNPLTALGVEIQGAIQKKSSSFLYEERPLEVSVCAGMAMVSILTATPSSGGWTTADVYATALWLTLAYQPVLEAERREALRREVLDAAQSWVTVAAKKARQRTEVPDATAVTITIGESNATTNNFNEAVAGTVEALRRNAALDREELDFLWWVQLGRSRLLNRQISMIDEPTRIVAAGIEGANMLRRLPSEMHREMVLRTLDQDPELTLEELLAALGEDRALLGSGFVDGNVAVYPTVFPLLHALATGGGAGSGASVRRRLVEWGERALLEAGFARMMSQGVAKL